MSEPGSNKRLILAAMMFAVAMTFIDQTIVSIAVPELQKDLGLSATGVQWVVNGYLLSLSALFAFGGRIADIAGHRRMVLIGIVVFAGASAMCGADADGLGGGGLDHRLPRDPGRRRGDHVPGRAGDRRRRLSGQRARQGAGDLLRRSPAG